MYWGLKGKTIFSLHRQLKTKMVVLFLVFLLLVVPFILVGCKNNPAPENIFFPVTKESNLEYPSVLGHGRLVLENNCLRLKPFYFFGKSDLLIWPYGCSLKIQDNKIYVVDKKGEIVAKVGNWIKVGGGNVPLEIVEKYIGESLPSNYSGPYWIVSKVISN